LLFDLAIGVGIAFAISCIVCAAMIQAGPLDMPNAARKAHYAPTPTSGGIGIALGFAAGLIALSLFSSSWRHEISSQGAVLMSTGAAFSYGFLALGFLDDAHPLSARLKFALFGALSIGVATSIGVVQKLPLGWGYGFQVGFWVGALGTALWVFTVVNCVNFMDGVNGLAMGSVAIGLLSLALIGGVDNAPATVGMAFCGAGALIGFLPWNFPRGRLFAGDSGALFAGAIAAAGALLIIRRTGLSPFVPAIVFFPLLADALLTLAWRMQRGRSLLDGHSEHMYQIALRAGWSHSHITLCYWAAMAVCGAIAFAVSRVQETGAPWITLGVLALLSLGVSKLVRDMARRRGIEEA
jgi:UDP-N-acetylmuramyl pentapeptide phosphotransferase/UDP-N-acetylglucosamine-1-phosphate transferase